MASICAVLHHKFDYYFWTGFYLYKNGKLIVGPYQGPLACQELEKDKGVCWAAYNKRSAMVVPDVHAFPGHISCDTRSKSEITVPVFEQSGEIAAIFDVDSDRIDSFNEVDRTALSAIMDMIYRN
jgi:GAF domain-containing protein